MFPQHLPDNVKVINPISITTLDDSNEEELSAAIDRQDYFSGVLAFIGEVTDEDSGFTIDVIVQDSDASDGTYAEYKKVSYTFDSTGDEFETIDLDLKAAKRYIKIEIDGDTADGVDASNKVDVAAVLILGGAVDKPVS